MPIEWTEKKTEELKKQLRVALIVHAPIQLDGVEFASSDTRPATIDDLAAAIRGMGEEEKKHIFHACELGDPCGKCAAERDEARRDLADARTALESAKAETERLRKELEHEKRISEERHYGIISCMFETTQNRNPSVVTPKNLYYPTVNAVHLLRVERDQLREKLDIRNQELDDQKAEPEWVRRMPEWAKEELGQFHISLPVYHAAAPHVREAMRELVGATIDIDTTDPRRSLNYLHDAIRHALRSAYLARKAGGE